VEDHTLSAVRDYLFNTFTATLHIWRSKTDEIVEPWIKLQNKKLHNLYSSPNIIRKIKSRRMRSAGHVARMGEKRNAHRIFVGKPEGKRPLERLRRR
jgi:hypothetical protein